jgi:FtsH-binding integral membrane protein
MNQLATHSITSTGDERVYFRRVFAWMSVALFVTGAVAGAIGHSQTAMHALLTRNGQWIWIACVVIELLLVSALVGLVQHMDLFQTVAIFIGYAALNGVTISVVFAIFTTKSIFATFLVAAGMFAVLAVIGATTNIDLTKWGSFLFMALIGQLIGLFVNLIWLNSTLYWVTTATGILLFSALTAYDVQKLKQYEEPAGADDQTVEKSAIVGALALYLDFVNLFLYLLRLFGRRR